MSRRDPGQPGQPFIRSYPFTFSHKVSADTQTGDPESETRTVPWDARIISVVLGWQAGAQNAAGVALLDGNREYIIPRDEDSNHVAANDFTHAYQIRHELQKDDQLRAEFINVDTENPHVITMQVMLQKRPPGGWP